ncbi:hypothetical protein CGRA01v4_12685 [Colletotrichum graminicola]|nr:hypothetical protein CGRA01v4_12685 [Colletotrichum graminicola]
MPPCFIGGLEFDGDAICSSAATPHPPRNNRSFSHNHALPRSCFNSSSTRSVYRAHVGYCGCFARHSVLPHSFGVVLEVVALELDELIVTKAA